MPSFSEIESENNPKNTIIKYAKKLHEKTGRNVIIYYSGWLTVDEEKCYIDSSDKHAFMMLIKDLEKSKGLDLILHTPGGLMDSTESIIDYLISIFGENIRAIIPQMAMSGGTMIACSSKEIIMGKQSSLGPVDPQMGEVSAQNVVKEFKLAKKEIKEETNSIPYWEILLNKYPINFLFECENLIEWSEEILEKSLKNSMFKENHQKTINQIIANLNSNEISKDHSRNFSAKKCEEIGLKIKYLEDDEELQDLVLSVHHACMSYINNEKACKIFLNQKNCFVINNENK